MKTYVSLPIDAPPCHELALVRRASAAGGTGVALVTAWLMGLLALTAVAPRVGAVAFWGPMWRGVTFHHPGTDPAVMQANNTFRWSAYTAPLAPPGPPPANLMPATPVRLKVHFDRSFTAHFGESGIKTVEAALKSWQDGSAAGAAPVGGRNAMNLPGARQFDLESVTLHEVGHALGLDHPDEAVKARVVNPMNPGGPRFPENLNFDALGMPPYVLAPGALVANTVMESTLAPGAVRRDLTLDEWAGVKFLFDPNNEAAPIAPEPSNLDANNNVVPIAGGRSVVLLPTGSDPLIGPPQAIPGTDAGRNIDIFAFDFAAANLPAGFPAPPESDEGEESSDSHGAEGKKGAGTLAFTMLRFSPGGGSRPGIIDGTPGAADGLVAAGCDIYFNTSLNISWFLSEIVPPPMRVQPKMDGRTGIYWPRTAGRLQLESSLTLAPAVWQPVTNFVSELPEEYAVEVEALGHAAFFRLRSIVPRLYLVTSSAGTNGSVFPSAVQTYAPGASRTYKATPEEGYVVDTWFVDNVGVAAGSPTYSITNVQADHQMRVTFRAAP